MKGMIFDHHVKILVLVSMIASSRVTLVFLKSLSMDCSESFFVILSL